MVSVAITCSFLYAAIKAKFDVSRLASEARVALKLFALGAAIAISLGAFTAAVFGGFKDEVQRR